MEELHRNKSKQIKKYDTFSAILCVIILSVKEALPNGSASFLLVAHQRKRGGYSKWLEARLLQSMDQPALIMSGKEKAHI